MKTVLFGRGFLEANLTQILYKYLLRLIFDCGGDSSGGLSLLDSLSFLEHVLLQVKEIMCNFAAWNIKTKCYVYAKCQNG